uniref:hypothetical protein n=1 Tax=Staphylococcus aureus TaxID=1280 RepID=UPI001C92EF47
RKVRGNAGRSGNMMCGIEGMIGCWRRILLVVVNGKKNKIEVRIERMEIGIKIRNGGLGGGW